MELSQTSNINYVHNNKTSFKVNDLQTQKGELEKDSLDLDKVDIQKANTTSNFLLSISSNINKITDLQKTQSLITNQLKITSEIVTTTHSAINSNTMNLDDKQPEIQQLLSSFNKLSEGFEKPIISDETGVYFDGQVGSKPLSSSEILDAVSQQRERLSQFNKQISDEIKSLVSTTNDTIISEKTTVETKVEFKNIDYEKESAQFNASTLNSVKGSIIPSQANAQPLHSEKLLA